VKGTVTVVQRHGLVLVSAWSGKMYALRETDGSLAWEHKLEGRLMASPAYDPTNDLVFLGSPGGIVVALSAVDGHEVWRRELQGAVYSSASVSGDGTRVVVGAGWDVVSLRTDNGAIVWRQRLDGLVSSSPSLVGSRVYVATRKGALWALDTSPGA
jgi:outer membrane protein assembly factor BamB